MPQRNAAGARPPRAAGAAAAVLAAACAATLSAAARSPAAVGGAAIRRHAGHRAAVGPPLLLQRSPPGGGLPPKSGGVPGAKAAVGARYPKGNGTSGPLGIDELARDMCAGRAVSRELSGECMKSVQSSDAACLARCRPGAGEAVVHGGSGEAASRARLLCYEDCLAELLFGRGCPAAARQKFWSGVINGTSNPWMSRQAFEDRKLAEEGLKNVSAHFWKDLCTDPSSAACIPDNATAIAPPGAALVAWRRRGRAAARSGRDPAGYARWLLRRWLPALLRPAA